MNSEKPRHRSEMNDTKAGQKVSDRIVVCLYLDAPANTDRSHTQQRKKGDMDEEVRLSNDSLEAIKDRFEDLQDQLTAVVSRIVKDEEKRDAPDSSPAVKANARKRLSEKLYPERDSLVRRIEALTKDIGSKEQRQQPTEEPSRDQETEQEEPEQPVKKQQRSVSIAEVALVVAGLALVFAIIALVAISNLDNRVDSIDTELGTMDERVITLEENTSALDERVTNLELHALTIPPCPEGWYKNPPPDKMPTLCRPIGLNELINR
jgi:predicted  nucleic acid-binding Zn-ribbon protein